MSNWNFSVMPFLLQVLLAALATRLLVRAKRSRSWPTVEATIVESRIKRRGANYEPQIVYAYAVDGKSYKSHRIAVGFSFARDKRSAERIAASYAKESRVVAAVDPKNHAYSVLARGIQTSHLVVAAFCSVLVLAGLFADLVLAGAFRT
jgi:hypothetical protein